MDYAYGRATGCRTARAFKAQLSSIIGSGVCASTLQSTLNFDTRFTWFLVKAMTQKDIVGFSYTQWISAEPPSGRGRLYFKA